jgi:rhamnosyltransferase
MSRASEPAIRAVEVPQRHEICAIIVTFHPDPGIADRIRAIANQVNLVIVVDNNSGNEAVKEMTELETHLPLRLILNSVNLGVATALNQGMAAAMRAGFGWAVTLDQDSIVDSSMVSEQLRTLARHGDPGSVLCVSPNIYTHNSTDLRPWGWLLPHETVPFLFRIVRSTDTDIYGVALTITSGALTNVAAYQDIGPFRDEYFIDYVDTEYCLRAQLKGYEILVSVKARLVQPLGDSREIMVFGRRITPTFHSALRRYYIQRNRVPTFQEFGSRFPHWVAFDVIVNGFHHLLILLFEDSKVRKLKSTIIGTWHGLRGRMGPR